MQSNFLAARAISGCGQKVREEIQGPLKNVFKVSVIYVSSVESVWKVELPAQLGSRWPDQLDLTSGARLCHYRLSRQSCYMLLLLPFLSHDKCRNKRNLKIKLLKKPVQSGVHIFLISWNNCRQSFRKWKIGGRQQTGGGWQPLYRENSNKQEYFCTTL